MTFSQKRNRIITMIDDKTKIKNTSFDELVKIFTIINDEKLMKDFMECLFTPAEREDFANRWTLVKEIDKGTTQREIAKNFNMSLCKITRGSKEFNKSDSAFKKVLEMYKEK